VFQISGPVLAEASARAGSSGICRLETTTTLDLSFGNNNNNHAQPHPTHDELNHGGGVLETLEAAEEAAGTRLNL
jgi:hypothetical protein